MSERIEVDMAGVRFLGSQSDREWEMVRYVDHLWGGDARGFACVGVGSGPYLDENGKYKHRSFGHKFFAWPYAIEAMVAFAARAAHHADVYVTPALRTRRDRQRGSAGPARFGWVDVDGPWDDERQRRWEAIRPKAAGAFMVDSGRGRHLYVPAGQWLGPDEIEEMNRKLSGLFTTSAGVGEKWESNALLRLPGTFNWKPWAAGGRPVPVALIEVVR